MSDSGKILFFDPMIPPLAPSSVASEPTELPDLTPAEALAELTRIITACGMDPVTQLAGYLIAEDPTYLPECGHARTLARRIGRDKLLEALIELYLLAHPVAPEPSTEA